MATNHKFSGEDDYNIHISGRHIQVTEAMKQYAFNKLSKIERFHNRIMDVHVTMDIQKVEHSVTIIVKFEHFKIKSHAASTDMYVSIDQAVNKLQTQLYRWKDKIQEHHNKKLSAIDLKVNVIQRPYDDLAEINQEIESEAKRAWEKQMLPGHVIGEKTISLKYLLVDEAIMKMELSGDHFLVYRSEEDRKIKVIYRREDGNYGIIHVE
jgi:putative sigma-54 modulation protein